MRKFKKGRSSASKIGRSGANASTNCHRDAILGMSYPDGEKRVREAEMDIEMVSFVFKDFFLTI